MNVGVQAGVIFSKGYTVGSSHCQYLAWTTGIDPADLNDAGVIRVKRETYIIKALRSAEAVSRAN